MSSYYPCMLFLPDSIKSSQMGPTLTNHSWFLNPGPKVGVFYDLNDEGGRFQIKGMYHFRLKTILSNHINNFWSTSSVLSLIVLKACFGSKCCNILSLHLFLMENPNADPLKICFGLFIHALIHRFFRQALGKQVFWSCLKTPNRLM